jgi:hypothetical protein
MVTGRIYWIWIWCGILFLGVLGLVPALQWARETQWRNLDEVLRAIGTICVSVGMILLLEGTAVPFAYLLLVLAIATFTWAFILGRHRAD